MKTGSGKANREMTMVKENSDWNGRPFTRKPATFIAVTELGYGGEKNLRFDACIKGASESSMELLYGTWMDKNIDHVSITWTAIEWRGLLRISRLMPLHPPRF